MKSEWRTRPMKHDGAVVFVIYRLADENAADENGNREYWPRDDCPAWAIGETAARQMARNLNLLDKLRRKGGETRGSEGEQGQRQKHP